MNFKTKLQDIANLITSIKRDKSTPLEERAKQLAEARALQELVELEQSEVEQQEKIDALINEAESELKNATDKLKSVKSDAKKADALVAKANATIKDLVQTLEELAAIGEMGRLNDAVFFRAWQYEAKHHAVKGLIKLDRPIYHSFEYAPLAAYTSKPLATAQRDYEQAKINLEHVKANAHFLVDNEQEVASAPEKHLLDDSMRISPTHQEIDLRHGTDIDDVEIGVHNHTAKAIN